MDIFSKIAGFLGGSCSQEEKQALDTWRKANPGNEKEFRKFEKIWTLGSQAANFHPDTELAWQKVCSRVCKSKKEASPNKHFQLSSIFRQAWTVATAIALLLLAAALLFLPDLQRNMEYAGLNSLKTTARDQQDIMLADGPHIWLNENSTLYYPDHFQDNIRQVHLKGEAYFEVAHQAAKPFKIHSGDGAVEVLGTSFNLLQAKNKLRLEVKSGKVKFSSPNQSQNAPLILRAGEAAVLENMELKKAKADPNMLSWKTGRFIFEDVKLQEVFLALQSYYHVKFKAADPSLLECRIFARFDQEPLQELLKVLSLTLNLQFEQDVEKVSPLYVASGKGCKPVK